MTKTVRKKRVPADQNGGRRQDVWDGIRKLKSFSATDLARETNVNRKTVSDYLACLEAGRIVERADNYDQTFLFHLVADKGFHAPRLRRDGTAVTQGVGIENMWRSMRMLPQFSVVDLAAHSTTDTVSVARETAVAYCTMLLKTGYLRVLQTAIPGRRHAIYRLIRNSGPQPPQVQRVKQIFDPNTHKVFVPEDQA